MFSSSSSCFAITSIPPSPFFSPHSSTSQTPSKEVAVPKDVTRSSTATFPTDPSSFVNAITAVSPSPFSGHASTSQPPSKEVVVLTDPTTSSTNTSPTDTSSYLDAVINDILNPNRSWIASLLEKIEHAEMTQCEDTENENIKIEVTEDQIIEDDSCSQSDELTAHEIAILAEYEDYKKPLPPPVEETSITLKSEIKNS